jgi:23S rRNA (guanosine2251-2'-O)-methyltransferase
MVKKTANKKIKKARYDVVCGVHSIIEVLRAKKRKLYSLYTTKPLPKTFERVKKYLPRRLNMQYVAKHVLDRMAGTKEHRGLVALVSEYAFCKKMFDPQRKPYVLLLDSIQDVRNLGGILRSAYCTGVDGVVLCKKGAATVNPIVHKTSAGLAEHLDIYIASSVQSAVSELKSAGYNLYMAVLDGKDATQVSYKKPVCLVIGNEAVGISKSVQKFGRAITLPQVEAEISYNASVASGILLFLVSRNISKIGA